MLLACVLILRYYKVAFVTRIFGLSCALIVLGAICLQFQSQKFEKMATEIELRSFLVEKRISESDKWVKYQISTGDKGLLYLDNRFKELEVGAYYSSSKTGIKLSDDDLPKRFDYPLYLRSKGLYFSAFINSFDTIYQETKKNNFLFFVDVLRNEVRVRILKLLKGKEVLGFYSAVLLGDKSWLDEETQTAFATLGISHFLAVSGLHVGIIYLLFGLVFGLNVYRKHKWLLPKIVIVILVIWLYALLSGFTLSVVRAAFMFTCFLFAKLLKRESNAFNILCFSAFINLLYNPMVFYDVGFQLSYAAVASIVLLFPKLQSLLTFKYKVLNWIWDAICVSACAQFGTLPIILYTFGYFPVWFLVSNLWLSVFSFMLTASAFLFLIISYIPFIDMWYSFLVNEIYLLFFRGIQFLEKLPYSKLEFFMEQDQMLILLILLGFWITYLYSRKRSALVVGLLVCIVFSLRVASEAEPYLNKLQANGRVYYQYSGKGRKWLFPKDYSTYFDDSFVKNNADNSLFKDYYRLPIDIRQKKESEIVVLRIVNGKAVRTEIK